MPTYFIDPVGGNDGLDGLSFATRWRTLAAGPTAARVAPGDEVRFIESPAPTLIGNCTWTNGGRTITVPAGTVRLIDALTANTGWVAAANVTLNAPSTTRLIGAGAVNVTVGAAFTTGKLAHKPLTMDLTGFQQVNCWVRSSSALVAQTLWIDLCSDATGDVPIVSIPVGDNTAAAWAAVIGAHTGSIGTINSIALRASADPGTPTITINCLWASKGGGSADEITLATLVSRTAYTVSPPGRGGGGGDEPLVPVVGVTSDTSVVLAWQRELNGQMETLGRPYDGTTGTAATWAHQAYPFREARDWGPNESATEAQRSRWTGGWSASGMAARTGMTRFFLANAGRLINSSTGDFYDYENFALTSYGSGNMPGRTGCAVRNSYLFGLTWAATFALRGMSAENCCYMMGNLLLGGLQAPVLNSLRNIYVYGGGSTNGVVTYFGGRSYVDGLTVRNGLAPGVGFAGNAGAESVAIRDLVTLNNNGAGVSFVGGVNVRLLNATINEASEFSVVSGHNDGMVSVESLDGIAGNDVTAMAWGRVTRQTAVVQTQPSAWEVRVTSLSAALASPMRFPLGLFEIPLGQTTNIAVRMRRTNTGLSLGLSYLPTEGLPGIAAEQRALMTAAANTWETVTLSLAPTGTGTRIVSIDLIAWGGTTHIGYVEAVTVS